MLRRLLLLSGSAAFLAVLAVAGMNLWIVTHAKGEVERDIGRLPHAQVALLLGAFVEPDGTLSTMLADRVSSAVQLYRTGKVDKILVSGDHGRTDYDEVNAIKRELLRQHVPPADIFLDHAGFDTLDSVVRAKEVFKVDSATVVSQRFHLARAVYLAEQVGLKAHGFVADRHNYGSQGRASSVREVGARTKAFLDALGSTNAAVLGPPIPITGDGRRSWD